ncbi:MAG: reverse transcriptase/maturase family protein [Patescibacteria group bacterium]
MSVQLYDDESWVVFDNIDTTKCNNLSNAGEQAKTDEGGGFNGKKIGFVHTYHNIISVDNLLLAWQEFLRGKKHKKDVQEFQLNLMDNILSLHYDLKTKTYTHGGYSAFNISDPKPRNIHKASVRDRLLHHAIHRVLYPYFDQKFIYDSYSCRVGKGTHKAMNRFRSFAYKVSKNNTKQCFVLKCDIRKFFASIDQEILLNILKKHITDKDTTWLLERVINSFSSFSPLTYSNVLENIGIEEKGLPLGNLTSQLLVNIYMNEFDQFIKHKLKIKYYIRYAGDFVILSQNKNQLLENIRYIVCFLEKELSLQLHPNKVFIKTLSSGVDFLGWVNFARHRVLRNTTKRRMLRAMNGKASRETMKSYLGMLKHGNAYKLRKHLL